MEVVLRLKNSHGTTHSLLSSMITLFETFSFLKIAVFVPDHSLPTKSKWALNKFLHFPTGFSLSILVIYCLSTLNLSIYTYSPAFFTSQIPDFISVLVNHIVYNHVFIYFHFYATNLSIPYGTNLIASSPTIS